MKLKKGYWIGIIALLIIIGFTGLYVVKSQNKLRDIKLTEAQNKSLIEADRDVEQVAIQYKSVNDRRASLVEGFAISSGLIKEDFLHFKFEKQSDGFYHFVELTPEEIKKQEAQQQSQQQGK
jgi:hypothetical protein